MKKPTLIIILLVFVTLYTQAAVFEVYINGQTQFCPGNPREVQYQLTESWNDAGTWIIVGNHCDVLNPVSNVWETNGFQGSIDGPPPDYISVRWHEGNFDDAWIEYRVHVGLLGWKKDNDPVKLVENVWGKPNALLTISSSVSSLPCGSTTPITFTANWKNATSYSWTVINGSGSSTGSTITVIPNSGTSYVKAKVRGYNSACNVSSLEEEKSVDINPPVVNEITGPNYVCYGAPSALNHYVNNIPGAQYDWQYNTSGNYTAPTGRYTSSATIKGEISGSFIISLSVTACGAQIIKTKTVNSTNNTPTPPYISQYPGTHCAGSCATYYTQIPNGFVIENQFRYNYGNWDVANSYGAMYICTQSYDAGYKPVELRSKGICGTYGSISTQSINISNCGYMMATSVEDSLTLAEMNSENDLVMYPNPSTTTMTISLPDDMQETQVTILGDQGEVIATFDNTKAMFTINTGKLQRGKYFLSVADKSKKLTKRFVVE